MVMINFTYQSIEGTKIVTSYLNPRLTLNLGGSEFTATNHYSATVDHSKAYGPCEGVQNVPDHTSNL